MVAAPRGSSPPGKSRLTPLQPFSGLPHDLARQAKVLAKGQEEPTLANGCRNCGPADAAGGCLRCPPWYSLNQKIFTVGWRDDDCAHCADYDRAEARRRDARLAVGRAQIGGLCQ